MKIQSNILGYILFFLIYPTILMVILTIKYYPFKGKGKIFDKIGVNRFFLGKLSIGFFLTIDIMGFHTLIHFYLIEPYHLFRYQLIVPFGIVAGMKIILYIILISVKKLRAGEPEVSVPPESS